MLRNNTITKQENSQLQVQSLPKSKDFEKLNRLPLQNLPALQNRAAARCIRRRAAWIMRRIVVVHFSDDAREFLKYWAGSRINDLYLRQSF